MSLLLLRPNSILGGGTPPDPNLLTGDNSDFSGGTVGDWAAVNANQQVLTTDPPEGFTHYLRVTSNGSSTVCFTGQNVSINGGDTYIFSGMYRVNTFNDQVLFIQYEPSPFTSNQIDATSITWQPFQITLASDIANNAIRLRIYSSLFGTAGNLDWIEVTGLSLVKV